MLTTASKKNIFYAVTSFLLGVWTFLKVNEVSGPAFEPIVAACTDSSISIDDFASKTGYHIYEPKVGFGAFNFLVCLTTQFLLELRETHPAGVLVWGGVILAGLPFSVVSCIESGRTGAKGPIRYPIAIGLLSQLLGVSVIVPLVWLPSFIFGKGSGAVSIIRPYTSVILNIPVLILTTIVFTVDTDRYLWTLCAGILGGPGLAMLNALLWFDKKTMSPSGESKSDTDIDKKNANLVASIRASVHAYVTLAYVGIIGWIILLRIAYTTYGVNVSLLWSDIWTNGKPCVAFMTVDTCVLYLAVVWYITYHKGVIPAITSIALTPILGPGAACSVILAQLEFRSLRVAVVTSSMQDKKEQ